MGNPIDKEGLELARTINAKLVAIREDIAALEAAVEGLGGGGAWGEITGTLSAQTDLNTALGLLAPKASPTFTGTVTIPSGASISGYLTASTAASTYAPISTKGMRQFDNDTTLLASTPEFIGQIAYSIDTDSLWVGDVLTAGGWSSGLRAASFIGSGAFLTGIPLATAVTGTLPKANGGTGLSSLGATGESLLSAATALAALQLLNIKTYIRTTDATARTANTFVADDTLASMPVTSGKSYLFIVSIRYTSATVGMQWKLVTPGHDGAVNAHGVAVGPGGGVGNLFDSSSSTDILATTETSPRTARRWFAIGVFRATATGNCAIHWSPNTTGGSAQFLTGSQVTMFELPG